MVSDAMNSFGIAVILETESPSPPPPRPLSMLFVLIS